MTDHLITSRENVAARYRAAGRDRDADAVLAGPDGWGVWHEVLRLERERAAENEATIK